MKTEKYQMGWSDPRAVYGTPDVKWEPIRYSHKYEIGEYLSWVGTAAGVSLTTAPLSVATSLLLLTP